MLRFDSGGDHTADPNPRGTSSAVFPETVHSTGEEHTCEADELGQQLAALARDGVPIARRSVDISSLDEGHLNLCAGGAY